MTRTPHRPIWRRSLPLIAAVAIGTPLFAVAMLMLFSHPSDQKRHLVQQVTLLRLPPPPPPPQEKPPEPPKPREEVKIEQAHPIDEPKPMDDQPPPAGPLGLDAQGNGPDSGFGLAGRPGGRDITLGSGNGAGSLSLTMFGNGTARHIAQELARNPKLKSATYRVEIRIWVAKDGRIEKEELVRGTDDPKLDAMIREGLIQVSPLRQPPPENLPQPLRIRVTSSDA